MSRSKSIASRKHRKVMKRAKGFRHSAGRKVTSAKEALLHAGQYAYIGRKLRRRDLRKLWIIRVNAAARIHGMSYSRFMSSLKKSKIELDRKTLSEIAISDPKTFEAIVDKARGGNERRDS